ncbi:unnamed protein product [Calypogeia fissa]
MQGDLGYWSRYHSMNDEPEAMNILSAAPRLPALVVFDLDYTLWPYFCECRSKNEIPVLYPQAKSAIQALKAKGVLVAVASRSPTADIARTFLNKLDLLPTFCCMEIYPSWSHKTDHLKKIHQKTGIPYTSMLFFDDEERNIQAVSQMGVKSVLVHNGVNLNALKEGLQKFGDVETGSDGQVRRQKKLTDFWNRGSKGKHGPTNLDKHR